MNNIDVGKLVKSAVPESEGRNVRVLSENTGGADYRDGNFLSQDFPRSPPKLYVTGDSDDFDEVTLREWRDEGFDVEYFSVESSAKSHGGFVEKLKDLSREKRAPCEKFGIIAYDDAAAMCLEHYHVLDNNPEFRLGLLVAYYPSSIPDPKGKFPNAISALVHLATGSEIGITKQSQMVGIQGKRRTRRSRVEAGTGTGGRLAMAYPSYSYGAEPGFAEHDVEEYDGVCADLAWSRSLAAARKVFGIDPDLEAVLERNLQSKFFTHDAGQAAAAYTTHKTPHVTNVPAGTGAVGASDLEAYYASTFANPPSAKVTLLSRTVGADRVVDEMHLRFRHTCEVPWMLPGVPATGKKVEVVVVSVVALRGGKLCREHVYWDQASVLVQVGLLDAKAVPQAGKELGVERLPIVGRKAARRVLNDFGDDDEGESEE